MSAMKVLVTGGAGFIGSHLVRGLLEHGYSGIVVADNFVTGKLENLSGVLGEIELRQLDLSDLAQARQAVEGVDCVLHHAAIPSVPRSVADPLESNSVNINATLNLLIAARDAGLKRFVYAASSAAYGDSEEQPKTEDMSPNPLSPYAIAKLASEYYCSAFFRLYGLPAISFRYFNVFGPRQDPNSEYSAVIPKFISAMLDGRSPAIFGNGEQSRDFIYVDNVVQANLLALEVDRGFGEVYNIACGGSITLNELFRKLRAIMRSDLEPTYAPARPGDVMHSQADISKAQRVLGFQPSVSFDDGLRQTAAWFSSSMEVASV